MPVSNMTDLADKTRMEPPKTRNGSATDPVLAQAPHRIGKIALTVHDLDRIASFYRDVIGLHVLRHEPGLVELGVGGSVLLELRHDPDARLRSPREAGLFHTAFLLPTRTDLGTWLKFAAEHGTSLHGASDHLVSEALYLADPEGNGIEIYADRPSTAWRWEDGMVVMRTDPLDLQDLVGVAAGRAWSGFPAKGTIGHVHLQVGAIAPAEAFYAGLLGLDITCHYPGGSFYGSGGYHHQLATNIWNSRGAPVRSEPVTGLSDVEIIVDPCVLGAVRSRLAPSQSNSPGATRLSLRDPWGIPVSLVSKP